MAALLCTLPCQVVGKGCAAVAHVIGESCRCLKPVADMLCDFSRPFTFVTVIAFFVLGVPVAMIAMALAGDTSGDACSASGIQADLMIQAGLFIGHFLFIAYVHSRFSEPEPASAVCKRFGDMFMYDLVFAFYFIYYGVCVWFTFRLSADTGEAYALTAAEQPAPTVAAEAAPPPAPRCSDVGAGLIDNATLAVSISFAYLLLMPSCLLCALCCAWNSGHIAGRASGQASANPPAYQAYPERGVGSSSGGILGTMGGTFSSIAGSFSGPSQSAAPGHKSKQPMV